MANENTNPGVTNVGADAETEKPDFSVKHPLERRWTLWFDAQNKKNMGNWGATLTPVCTVSTVEEFWCLFNNILSPGFLEAKADLFLFEDGVKPDWDEAETAPGGIWTAAVKGKGQQSKEMLDRWWQDVVLHVIGEQFEDGDDIVGVAVNVRKSQDRLVMWTKTASNEAKQISLGKQLKAVLELQPAATIGFVSHEQAKKDSKTNQKDTYTV